MLRVIKTTPHGLKYAIYSSLALSFASFGDAFLYPFLPQYAEIMEIPVVFIGVMLSINRFIRILFNPIVIRLFSIYGIRNVTIAASAMAIISTLGYGAGWGLLSLLLFRIIWGMAYAILRISALAYAFEHEYVGVSLGVSKSIQEAGPMLSLWLGPMLLSYFSTTHTFFLLALVSLPSLLYAVSLPHLKYIPLTSKGPFLKYPSILNLMTFVTAFVADGMLIVATGIFLSQQDSTITGLAITSMAAGYLAYRRLGFILFSPVAGWVAQRFGFTKLFHFSFVMIIIGLYLVVNGLVPAGLIITFTFNCIYSTIAPAVVANQGVDKIKAVAANASWWDVGAATGALIGGSLLSASILTGTFMTAIFILVLLLIFKLWKM